jgi:hypothetical protein
MTPSTRIDADRGDVNLYDLDANIALDGAQDKIWFTAKRRRADADGDAVVSLGLNVVGLSGIVMTDAPNGKFQVQIPKTALVGVEDFALYYDVQIEDASQGNAPFTVQSGPMILSGEITQAS